MKASVLVLLGLFAVAQGFVVPQAIPTASHLAVSRSRPVRLAEEGTEAAPTPEAAAPAKSDTESSGAGVMPDNFMGIFDMKTTFGSLGASLTVAVIFCVVVELIKLIDPNPSSPSMFASLF